MKINSANDFDGVAKIYDGLSTLVFGRSIFAAQTLYLSEIPPDANVLILGGGTGWLLAELLKMNSTCCIWYIEASLKMLTLTKSKIGNSTNSICYIHGTESSIPSQISFDAVITNFFLDLFSTETCNRVITKVKASLHANSIWVVTDFRNTTWWQLALLTVMYKFFNKTCFIEAYKLPKWELLLNQKGFVEIKSQTFYGKFIKSTVFLLKI